MRTSSKATTTLDQLGLRKRIVVAEVQALTLSLGAAAKTRPFYDEGAVTALEEMLMREGAAHATGKSYRSALRMLVGWCGRPLT